MPAEPEICCAPLLVTETETDRDRDGKCVEEREGESNVVNGDAMRDGVKAGKIALPSLVQNSRRSRRRRSTGEVEENED